MTDSSPINPAAVKRRQYLLLAGIAAFIVGAALLSVSLTGSREPGERVLKPKSTQILAPGGQVDPKDAWRGQADAQLKGIEQKSHELTQRNTELEGQNKQMLERLKKLEQTGLTPLPPPPVAAPATRPNFGPDRPGSDQAVGSPQRLPPPPLPRPFEFDVTRWVSLWISRRSASADYGWRTARVLRHRERRPWPTGPRRRQARRRRTPPRRILRHGTPAATSRAAPSPARSCSVVSMPPPADSHNAIRSPCCCAWSTTPCCPITSAQGSRNASWSAPAIGDVSSERAYIRTESLSCVTREGTAIDVPIKGYVAGEDGKAGMRGRLVSKQGQLLANALLAGVASGIGQAFQQSSTTMSVSPLGATSTVEPGKQFEAGFGTGVGKALDRLAQYYISLAEKVFPVIEIDAGRTVDVVITQGISLQGPLDAASRDDEEFPQLAERTRNSRRTDDDDQ
jgi:conjugal transfer pilus assembly protein TraB